MTVAKELLKGAGWLSEGSVEQAHHHMIALDLTRTSRNSGSFEKKQVVSKECSTHTAGVYSAETNASG